MLQRVGSPSILIAHAGCHEKVGQAGKGLLLDLEIAMTKDVDVLLREFVDGRTDLVFDLLQAGCPPDKQDQGGISLLRWCAYYGDVSAIRFLLSRGIDLDSLGDNLDLNGACFHGHWRLCKFLIEKGADVNASDGQTGETLLHAVLCNTDRLVYDKVLQILLSSGADPNVAAKNGAETGGLMRDSRTKGETPLHRAAAFGNEGTITMLLEHGAKIDAQDANGDTPLSWASWYLRPDPILRLLCFGDFRINPSRRSMRENLVGFPYKSSQI
jgi:ankyrin repeat protein